MTSMRAVRVIFVIATVIAVLPLRATPASAFTEGGSNNFFGTGAGANNTGNNVNSFFGANAGFSNTTGTNNSFFGHAAGFSNTTACCNAFFGTGAGNANTTGRDNSFFGANAGLANTRGTGNTFFGAIAGFSNTTGDDNAFFGRSAGTSNTTGGNNSFFGTDAGGSNTTGIDNAFFGRSAGFSNTTGASNSFFGFSAGRSTTTGLENSFFGTDAGLANTAGGGNSFFGRSAGLETTTGADNTFMGLRAGRNNTTGAGNAFFGSAAGFGNTAGFGNAFFGSNAGSSNTTGAGNSFVGPRAGFSNTTENLNTFIGAITNGVAGITNATALGQRAQVSQSDSLVLGSIAGVNTATSSVNVGIGNTAPKQVLHLTDDGAARFRIENAANGAVWDFQASGGGGSFVIDRVGGPASLDFEMQPDGDLVVRGSATATSFITSSDRNLKTDITPAKASKLMSLLRQLDISSWRFKDQAKGTINLGPMAQDFHRLFGMGTSTTIDVRDLAALALVAAQGLDGEAREQAALNTAQQKEIDALKTAVRRLSSRR